MSVSGCKRYFADRPVNKQHTNQQTKEEPKLPKLPAGCSRIGKCLSATTARSRSPSKISLFPEPELVAL